MRMTAVGATLLLSLGVLAGCAFDVIAVKQVPAHFESIDNCGGTFELTENVDIALRGGYQRVLKSNTEWYCVGRITQGYVFATKDQVFTIEASNIFEAYLVLSSRKLVGFYLPVEQTFSPLSPPIDLPVKPMSEAGD